MSQLSESQPAEAPDWDAIYRQGTPPWETDQPAGELVRLCEQELLRPGRTLELGCGTGADAIYLAGRGFEITGVECSPIAVERAHHRAEDEDAVVRFVLDDVFEFAQTAGQFDLVYDAGFYHSVRLFDLDRLLDLLWRVTRPGSLYFALVGGVGKRAEGGPPQVSKDEIHDELGRLFDFVHLRKFTFESLFYPEGYPGWSCLMRRPVIGG